MTFVEAMSLEQNTPIMLNDGQLGLIIRWWEPDELGVQVPGEEDIRTLKVETITDISDGMLLQSP